MYSVEWESSREDSNCLLEDGSEILGYNIISASNDDDIDYFNTDYLYHILRTPIWLLHMQGHY